MARGLRLSEVGVRRARVHGQLLGEHDAGRDVAGVVSTVVGVQAQDLAAAAVCIWARAPDLRIGDVLAAAGRDPSIVLTWSLRGTRHLHHAADLRWLVGLVGPVLNRPGRRAAQLGTAGDAGDRAVATVRAALSEGPLTRSEIKQRLAPLGIDVSGQAPIHVLQRAGIEGILVILPDPHGEERYLLTDDWVPAARAIDPDEAPAMLASRYLAAYGPATPEDFRAWSGLPSAAARQAWAAAAGEMAEIDGPAGRMWILEERRNAVLAAAGRPGPLRLTGGFDTLLGGYRDRSLHLGPEQAPMVNPGGGLVKPTVVDDGRVVGTWRYLRERPHDRIEVTLFRQVPRRDLTGEVAGVGRFLGTDPALDLVAGPEAV